MLPYLPCLICLSSTTVTLTPIIHIETHLSESKYWKSSLSSEEVIDKYLKPQLEVKKLPQKEYKHLADLLNKAEDRKEPSVEGERLGKRRSGSQALPEHKEERPNHVEASKWTLGSNRDQVLE